MTKTPAQAETSVFAEDLTVGQRFELGNYTVHRQELVRFARQWDDQWFHVDAEAASAGYFGDLIASGVQTIAILQRLSVAAVYGRWKLIAGLGFDQVRFLEPVRPGDVLTGSLEITNVVLNERRGRISIDQQLVNQHGRAALTATLTVVLWRRES